MSQYYLMAQLPALDGLGDTTPLPITEERFAALCRENLSKKAWMEFEGMTLLPSRHDDTASSPLVKAWNKGEQQLRLALGQTRAAKRRVAFDAGDEGFPLPLMQTVQAAVEMEDPMAAEQFLDRYRLSFLETLRPMDGFCDDAVYFYGLKLKLLWRIRRFDEARGETAYRSIYNSILHGETMEVTHD